MSKSYRWLNSNGNKILCWLIHSTCLSVVRCGLGEAEENYLCILDVFFLLFENPLINGQVMTRVRNTVCELERKGILNLSLRAWCISADWVTPPKMLPHCELCSSSRKCLIHIPHDDSLILLKVVIRIVLSLAMKMTTCQKWGTLRLFPSYRSIYHSFCCF